MMSAASSIEPFPFGSSARSRPSRSAIPLHSTVTELQTLYAYSLTPGATPTCVPSLLRPPRMSLTWVP